MLALPGGAYVYQGEELGLWEVLDLPDEVLADPIWERSGHTRRGRDGARVPLPWTADGPIVRVSAHQTARDPGCRSRPPGPRWLPSSRPATPARCSSCTGAALAHPTRSVPAAIQGPMSLSAVTKFVVVWMERADREFILIFVVRGT